MDNIEIKDITLNTTKSEKEYIVIKLYDIFSKYYTQNEN